MKRIVSYSGGIQSWATAHRVVHKYGTDEVTLLFADTKIEHEDLYRFLDETAADLGCPLVKLSEGRTPWDVFFDVKMIGNTRADPCSRILKREMIRKWLVENCDPADTVHYIGFAWDEFSRYERAKDRHLPWKIEAPLLDPPYLLPTDIMNELARRGIEPPLLTRQGFPHNNCGGFCIKAGQAQFAKLLKIDPERYHWHEVKEQDFRLMTGKDVSILRDRIGGPVKPLTLKTFRERIERGDSYDLFEWGGCACMEPGEDEIDSDVKTTAPPDGAG